MTTGFGSGTDTVVEFQMPFSFNSFQGVTSASEVIRIFEVATAHETFRLELMKRLKGDELQDSYSCNIYKKGKNVPFTPRYDWILFKVTDHFPNAEDALKEAVNKILTPEKTE